MSCRDSNGNRCGFCATCLASLEHEAAKRDRREIAEVVKERNELRQKADVLDGQVDEARRVIALYKKDLAEAAVKVDEFKKNAAAIATERDTLKRESVVLGKERDELEKLVDASHREADREAATIAGLRANLALTTKEQNALVH